MTQKHLSAVGVDTVPHVILATEDEKEFSRVILDDEMVLDVEKSEEEMVRVSGKLVARNPEVGAIVLECTNMPPYAAAIQRETGLPVLLHQRGYHQELMEAIHREKPPVSAIHGFGGDLAELQEWLDLVPWKIEDKTDVLTSDGHNAIVFATDKEVISFVVLSRSDADFWKLSRRCFQRSDSHFVKDPESGTWKNYVHRPKA